MNDKPNDIEAAVQAGRESALAKDCLLNIDDGTGEDTIPIAITPAGMSASVLHDILRIREERADGPRRTIGSATLVELASFVAHANRFKNENSVVFADTKSTRLTAIYDYHDRDDPAWCGHRAVYSCPQAKEWVRWLERSGKFHSQDAFADFVEENLEDLTSPEKGKEGPQPAEILEMARNLNIHSKGVFERKVNPTTGEYTMVCKEENEASSTKIPRCFFLALRVFEGGDKYRVEARVRFKISEGRPSFCFVLHQASETIDKAFGEVRDAVMESTGLLLMAGSPE